MPAKLLITARSCYALALIVFGFQQCLLGTLVAGRPPALPAQNEVLAYVTGALLIITGLLVLVQNKFQDGLLAVGFLILGGAALPNLVTTISHADTGAVLTNTGKGLTLGSGAFLVFSTFYQGASAPVRAGGLGIKIAGACQYCFGLFLLASGIQHFLFADFVKALVPVWIPGNLFWVYASGVFLILAGICLLAGWQRRRAGRVIALVILCWFFVLHLPRAIGENGNANEWTASFEALAFSGLAYLISQSRSRNAAG